MKNGNKAEKACVTVSPAPQPNSSLSTFYCQTSLMVVPHHCLAIVKKKKRRS